MVVEIAPIDTTHGEKWVDWVACVDFVAYNLYKKIASLGIFCGRGFACDRTISSEVGLFDVRSMTPSWDVGDL
jgi:hypothetical protein